MFLNQLLSNRFLPQAYLLLLSVLLFLPSLHYSFTYDDVKQILENPYITTEMGFVDTIRVFILPTYPGDLYRPLTMLSIKLNFFISGLNPISYHATNIAISAISIIVVYQFILLLTKNKILSFISSLIFLIHPIHIEAIANIYNRSEVLVSIFGVASLICFYRLLENPTVVKYLGLGALLMLAFLSKESSLTLVGIFPLIYYFFIKNLSRPQTRTFILTGVVIVITVASYLIIRKLVLAQDFLVKPAEASQYFLENPLLDKDFASRIIPSMYILGEYLRLIILPLKLSSDYSLPEKYYLDIISSWTAYSAILLTTLYLFTIAWLTRIKSTFCFWGIFFLVTFSLTINLILPIGTFMGDRLAYLPSLGLIVLIANLLLKLPRYRTPLLSIYVLILLVHTTQRLPIWENNISLFHQTLDDNSTSPKAAYNLGTEYQRIKDYEKSIHYYKEAIFRDPTYHEAVNAMIQSYAKSGNWQGFEYWIQKYIEANPNNKKMIEIQRKYKLTKLGLLPLPEEESTQADLAPR